MFIIVNKMELDVDQLLLFCAYYQVSKHASKLTIQTASQEISSPEPPKPKLEKTARRKLEAVAEKKPEKAEKVIKPKMEVVPKKAKHQPIPIKAERLDRADKRQGEDLTYFLSHMTGNTHDSQKRYDQIFTNNNRDYEVSARTPQYSSKNYDTFGRSNHNYQYETYESKMQKQSALYSRGNLTERPQQIKNYMQRSNLATDPKQQLHHDPYTEASKTKKFWENTVYQTRRKDEVDFSNLMYSPVRRENPSPTHSFIFSEMQDRSVSKSKSKLKRKNSERPFYNASQLAPKERENEARARKNEYQPSVLSNSFISTEQMRITNNKKAFDDDGRRETSTTTYAAKNTREGKTSVRRDPLENDLDDGIGEMINQIATQQRNAPIAISLVSREAKF